MIPGIMPRLMPVIEVAGPGPVTPGSTTFDSGSGNYTVPNYNTLTIELWGGGATGGSSNLATAGNASTVSTYGLTAGGGGISATTQANVANSGGLGGTASGGNTTNTNGNQGGSPAPTNGAAGVSGKGGDCPNGGTGGAAVATGTASTSDVRHGNPGNAPGGGGSGRCGFSIGGGGTFVKYPGGGAGAYVKHVFTFGAAGAPSVGASIAYAVAAAAINASGFDGNGAAGRIKFTVA